jgi:formate/nitrite transporter FocA (FNT family)
MAIPESERTFSAASKLDDLSDQQKHEVEQQSRPNAALIHETIRAEGESELERGTWALALSALAAGLSMGFSMVGQGELSARLPAGPARELLSPLGYTLGFLIVVVGRQQLFTENTLTPVLALIHNRNLKTFLDVLRLWGIVLLGNVIGAILFALVAVHDGAFDPNAVHAFMELGHEALRGGFFTTFVRAIYAGWLIALMVWLLPAAEGSRPNIIIIITYIVALAGFSHIIAGSVDCAFLVYSGGAGWSDFATRFFAPTLLGNIVGGVTLVAALNYGQVAPEIEQEGA